MEKIKKSDIYALLQERFGHQQFRANQYKVICDILDGGSRFVSLPTGAGKSLCYLLPAFLFSNLTLVVTPLLALERDQEMRALQVGLRLGRLGQTNNEELKRCQIVFATPEALHASPCLEGLVIDHFVIDEAHCVDSWGSSFRPFYGMLAKLIYIMEPFSISMFSASANGDTRQRVCENLSLLRVQFFQGSYDRTNIVYHVVAVFSPPLMAARLLSLRSGRSLVYCSSRREVETVTILLQKNGLSAWAYHAGMPDQERRAAEKRFMLGRVDILVATTAFGMGVDISNIHTVIHIGVPDSIDGYYQASGRGGRDGGQTLAVVILAKEWKRHARVESPGSLLLRQVAKLPSKIVDERFFLKLLADIAGGRFETDQLFAFLLYHRVYAREVTSEGVMVFPKGEISLLMNRAARRVLQLRAKEERAVHRFLYAKRCRRASLLAKYAQEVESCSGCDICGSEFSPLLKQTTLLLEKIERIQARLASYSWREQRDLVRQSGIESSEKVLLDWSIMHH